MPGMVLFLIDTEANDVSVYSSSESLTGDLEVYDVDDGGFQVYDAQARYLPLTWQAPDPRRRWAGQRAWAHHTRARRTGSTTRCSGSCHVSAARTWPTRRSWTSRQQPKRSAITTVGRSSRPRWRWPWQRGRKSPCC
jgi:hypothetical protein